MLVGNEGVGIVVVVGKNVSGFVGILVVVVGGVMYFEYWCVLIMICLFMLDGINFGDVVVSFVNFLMVLVMFEIMCMENYMVIINIVVVFNLG